MVDSAGEDREDKGGEQVFEVFEGNVDAESVISNQI